jgi:hypothetical protein
MKFDEIVNSFLNKISGWASVKFGPATTSRSEILLLLVLYLLRLLTLPFAMLFALTIVVFRKPLFYFLIVYV